MILRRVALTAAVMAVVVASAGFGLHGASHAATDEEVRNGDALQLLLPLAAWGLTYAYDDPEGRSQFYWSYLTTMAITHTLKSTVPEQRPSGDTRSYVSGHTASAFAGAAFMQMRYGWGWGLPAYAAAIYTGQSRIDEPPHHYQGDVNRGALIAIVTTFIFTSRYSSRRVRVAPLVGPDGYGWAMEARW